MTEIRLTQNAHDILSTADFGSKGLVSLSKCLPLRLENLLRRSPHDVNDIPAPSKVNPEQAEEIHKRPLEPGRAKMGDFGEHLETPEVELLLGRSKIIAD